MVVKITVEVNPPSSNFNSKHIPRLKAALKPTSWIFGNYLSVFLCVIIFSPTLPTSHNGVSGAGLFNRRSLPLRYAGISGELCGRRGGVKRFFFFHSCHFSMNQTSAASTA